MDNGTLTSTFTGWRDQIFSMMSTVNVWFAHYILTTNCYVPLARYVWLQLAHAPGMPEAEKCSQHSRRLRNPQLQVSGKRLICLIWGDLPGLEVDKGVSFLVTELITWHSPLPVIVKEMLSGLHGMPLNVHLKAVCLHKQRARALVYYVYI